MRGARQGSLGLANNDKATHDQIADPDLATQSAYVDCCVDRSDWRTTAGGHYITTCSPPPLQTHHTTNTSPKHIRLAMSSEDLPQDADRATSMPASAPVVKAYSIPGHYAWHIYSAIRHMTYHTTVRDVVAAQRDNTRQLLFVCSQETPRSVAWIYATFGDPDKYNFHFSGAQTLDSSMDEADKFTDLVDFFAERIGAGALPLEIVAEPEGTGWHDIMVLAAARIEEREEPANAKDIEEHFTNVVIPRLLQAARSAS
ncbi:hypothetical protein LTR42_009386 [Elasticomyces elasticus]|nr:hypothetical protein LTR42_009386 [Elasticomyces elasticus]